MKRILKYIFASLTLIFIAFLIFLVIIHILAIKNERPVKIFNYYYSIVVSESMEDVIYRGDYILYKPQQRYEEEDIIVFQSQDGERLIVHEIIRVTPGGFITKGTNNDDDDLFTEGVITEERIYGKVVSIIHAFGIGETVLDYRNILIIGIITISLSLIIYQVVDIVKTIMEKQEEDIKKNR